MTTTSFTRTILICCDYVIHVLKDDVFRFQLASLCHDMSPC